jgi:hypothetical protein
MYINSYKMLSRQNSSGLIYCTQGPAASANLLWETIAIVEICGVRKSEQNILNKLSHNLSDFSITELCGKSNHFLQQ